MIYLADRVQNFGASIFFEMTNLANEYQAVNLGQGFPDFSGPDFIQQAASEAIATGLNQYAPSSGQVRLREAIAAKMERHYGLKVDPASEITVTAGATEAIFASILGLLNPGEEAIIFEPFYDSYVPSVQMAGGTPRFYTLRPPDWHIDMDELARLFTDKTKLILINTPHNPTGKVFTQIELSQIADLCIKHDVVAVMDEVYEHIIFDGREHISMATLPEMAERTITISSTGKTFSMTGWKIGWAIATPDLVQAVFRTHQFIVFCGAAPLQYAMGVALETGDDYYEELATVYQERRDFLVGALTDAGLNPIVPGGTYFAMVDISHLGFANDVDFCRHLTKEVGVAAIPPSAFYHNPADGATLARFAFCKTQPLLEEAVRRLAKLNR